MSNTCFTLRFALYLDVRVAAAGELRSAQELRHLLAEGVRVVPPPVELSRSESGLAEGDDVVEEKAVRHFGLPDGLDARGLAEHGATLKAIH